MGHYEKKIRKTQKVARTTKQSLVNQTSAMATLKSRFDQHMLKIQAKQDGGNTIDHKRLKEMKVKMQQIAKVLPYLEKYVEVNQQAEIQTLAILRESCNQELQELKSKYKLNQPNAQIPSPSFATLPLSKHGRSKTLPNSKMNSLTRPKKSRKGKKEKESDEEKRLSTQEQVETVPSSSHEVAAPPATTNQTDSPHTTKYQNEDLPEQSRVQQSEEHTPKHTPSQTPLHTVQANPSPSTHTAAYEEPQYAVLGHMVPKDQPKPQSDSYTPQYAELSLPVTMAATSVSDESMVNYAEVNLPTPVHTAPALVEEISLEEELAESTVNDDSTSKPVEQTQSSSTNSLNRRPPPPPVSSKPSRSNKQRIANAPSYPPPNPPPPPPVESQGTLQSHNGIQMTSPTIYQSDSTHTLTKQFNCDEPAARNELSVLKNEGLPSLAQRKKVILKH